MQCMPSSLQATNAYALEAGVSTKGGGLIALAPWSGPGGLAFPDPRESARKANTTIRIDKRFMVPTPFQQIGQIVSGEPKWSGGLDNESGMSTNSCTIAQMLTGREKACQ